MKVLAPRLPQGLKELYLSNNGNASAYGPLLRFLLREGLLGRNLVIEIDLKRLDSETNPMLY
eukprot:CAMPEP_0171889810 /NCGR_PEP_ID=MMETSP0992-20121227/43824_1 /TAXON_ID=483369 /ORGANISM="non described non described, Strain CCMP2098" /LENGTH=61 /DNA_ID=CAMNT_0012516943 /DNA_START=1 /DNA_END=183 /DNA_ORIENTATION=-